MTLISNSTLLREKFNSTFNALKKAESALHVINNNYKRLTDLNFKIEPDKWKSLPQELGKKLKLYGLTVNENFTTCILKYTQKSILKPENYKSNYFIGYVLNGTLINEITGESYKEGQIIFTTKENFPNIKSKEDSTYIYTIFTKNTKLINNKESLINIFNVYDSTSWELIKEKIKKS